MSGLFSAQTNPNKDPSTSTTTSPKTSASFVASSLTNRVSLLSLSDKSTVDRWRGRQHRLRYWVLLFVMLHPASSAAGAAASPRRLGRRVARARRADGHVARVRARARPAPAARARGPRRAPRRPRRRPRRPRATGGSAPSRPRPAPRPAAAARVRAPRALSGPADGAGHKLVGRSLLALLDAQLPLLLDSCEARNGVGRSSLKMAEHFYPMSGVLATCQIKRIHPGKGVSLR